MDMQISRLLIGITTAVFIGTRFVPPRLRPIVGRILTACYLIAAVILGVYIFHRSAP